MENVISEFKVIETDDGFRIEIKGDKEHIRAFLGSFGAHKGGRWTRRRGSWGAHGFHPMMWMKMAPCWGTWDYEVEDEDKDEVKEA